MFDPMDVVREFYDRLNRSDVDGLVALYHADCVVEHVFLADDGVVDGRDRAQAGWTAEFSAFAGGFAGGHRVQIGRISGIETGWGWVRSDWLGAVRPAAGGAERYLAGHSHFWVEGGLIRRHRSVVRDVDPPPPGRAAPDGDRGRGRDYPTRPVVGVGAVVLTARGEVVLVKRRYEPLAGQWSLPGGMLELGETLEAGAAREIQEETGLVVDVGPVIEVFDRILVDEAGRVRYHFVLVDYLCRPRGDDAPRAGSDVADVALADPQALGGFRLAEKAGDIIRRAVALAVLLVWLVAPLSADLKYTLLTTTRPHPASAMGGVFAGMAEQLPGAGSGEGSAEAIYIVGKRGVRTEYVHAARGTPAGAVSLLRPGGQFIMLDPATQTYWQTTVAALRGQLEATHRQSGLRPVSSSGRTGEIATIAGLRAERVAFTWSVALPRPELPRDAPPDVREMFADWPAALTMEGEFWVATDQYRSYAKAASEAAAALAPMGMDVIPTDRVVLRSTIRSFGIEVDAVVTSIAEEDVPAVLFEIPAGYREVPSPVAGGLPLTTRIDNAASAR